MVDHLHQPTPKHPKKTLLLAVIIIVLVCLGFFTSRFVTPDPTPALVVQQQLTAFNDGAIEQAYLLMSTDFQEQVSLAEYRQLIHASGYAKTSNLQLQLPKISGNKATVTGMLLAQIDGASTQKQLAAQLIKENEDWKILSVRIF